MISWGDFDQIRDLKDAKYLRVRYHSIIYGSRVTKSLVVETLKYTPLGKYGK